MRRNEDGSVTFERSEVVVLRAALFTVEHYADQVWDQTEVHAVSGFHVEDFQSARRSIDSLKTEEDRRADSVERVRGTIAILEERDDSEFTQTHRLRHLRYAVDEALNLGVGVSDRLQRLASEV